MDAWARYTRKLCRVNGWGARHLLNDLESGGLDYMAALPIMWAVPPSAFLFLDQARPGEDALPNSDMGGSESFDDKMFHLLMQRACETRESNANRRQGEGPRE